MNENLSTALIIFARYPEAGRVKTRLAAETGDAFAAELYRLCAEHTFEQCRKAASSGIKSILFYSDHAERDLIEKWAGSNFIYYVQSGDDLGRRMTDAFKKVFELGAKKVLIIGTDLPDISAELIVTAAEELNNFDAVIGPAADGGYYLLGLKNNAPELFEKINWSTGTVFKETELKLRKLNLKYKTLKVMNDIDTKKDLISWTESTHSDAAGTLKMKVKILMNGNI